MYDIISKTAFLAEGVFVSQPALMRSSLSAVYPAPFIPFYYDMQHTLNPRFNKKINIFARHFENNSLIRNSK
jgi:hypothetical protein